MTRLASEQHIKTSDGAQVALAEEGYSIEDGLFHFRLLLEDLARLAAMVDGHWDRYINGDLDLAAVAIATIMAFQLARHLEDEARIHLLKIVAHLDPQCQLTAQKNGHGIGEQDH
jgi:hypothetical protein